MCGIYGYVGKPNKDTQKIIKRLGVLNQSRGKDSTGIAIIQPHKYVIYKKTVNANRFYNGLYPHKTLRIDNDSQFVNIIGHTRLATRGAITPKNAHPHKLGNLVFAHNGIISNFDELQGTYNTDYEVDSKIIGHLLLRKKEFEAFSFLAGSYAVPFTRLDSPSLVKVAVNGSPLSLATTENGWFYSSLRYHLESVLDGMNYKIFSAKDGKIYKLNYKYFPLITNTLLEHQHDRGWTYYPFRIPRWQKEKTHFGY